MKFELKKNKIVVKVFEDLYTMIPGGKMYHVFGFKSVKVGEEIHCNTLYLYPFAIQYYIYKSKCNGLDFDI